MSLEEKIKAQGFDISEKTACVIGCGGLGTVISVHLAGAGIKKLYLCDFDKVESSNLNRQFLYCREDIGKTKCEAMKAALEKYSSFSSYVCINKKIKGEADLSFAKDCDIIFSAVDNHETVKILEDFSTRNNIPLVCGGIDGFYGMAYLYLPGETAPPSYAGFSGGEKAKFNIGSTAGIIGSFQASLAIRYLITKDKSLGGRLLIFDEKQTETLKINYEVKP